MNLIKLFKEKLSDESVLYYNQLSSGQNRSNIIEEMVKKFPEFKSCSQLGERTGLENFALTVAVVEFEREKAENKLLSKKKILIIEHDLPSRVLLNEILRKYSRKIYNTDNETDTFRILAQKPIDIVLMEVLLSKCDGFQLLKKIKSQYPSLPVIVQSVCVMKHEKQECFSNGCDDFIAKPIIMNDLMKTLDFWLLQSI